MYLDDTLMESTTYMSSGLEEDDDGVRYLSLGAGVSIPEEMSPDTLRLSCPWTRRDKSFPQKKFRWI